MPLFDTSSSCIEYHTVDFGISTSEAPAVVDTLSVSRVWLKMRTVNDRTEFLMFLPTPLTCTKWNYSINSPLEASRPELVLMRSLCRKPRAAWPVATEFLPDIGEMDCATAVSRAPVMQSAAWDSGAVCVYLDKSCPVTNSRGLPLPWAGSIPAPINFGLP